MLLYPYTHKCENYLYFKLTIAKANATAQKPSS